MHARDSHGINEAFHASISSAVCAWTRNKNDKKLATGNCEKFHTITIWICHLSNIIRPLEQKKSVEKKTGTKLRKNYWIVWLLGIIKKKWSGIDFSILIFRIDDVNASLSITKCSLEEWVWMRYAIQYTCSTIAIATWIHRETETRMRREEK